MVFSRNDVAGSREAMAHEESGCRQFSVGDLVLAIVLRYCKILSVTVR